MPQPTLTRATQHTLKEAPSRVKGIDLIAQTWIACWNEALGAQRFRHLVNCVAESVSYIDAGTMIHSRSDLARYIGACKDASPKQRVDLVHAQQVDECRIHLLWMTEGTLGESLIELNDERQIVRVVSLPVAKGAA